MNFDVAIADFFDRTAVVRGQSVKACVFPPSKADPLSDVSADTDCLVTTILLRRIGPMAWNDPANPPKVGDEIAVGERTYAIAKVDLFDDNYFTLTAKLK